jgi:transposase InsO family protein
MGSIGDCFDIGLAESFLATLQTELLDRHSWTTRDHLANAVFAYLEGFYNPAAGTPHSATSAPPTTRPRGIEQLARAA